MEFQEKLTRRIEQLNENKARVAHAAGLTDSTISSYFSSRGSLPRIDIALKIARVLKVPLDWLADDEQGWPPPKPQSNSPTLLPDEDIVGEFQRRLMFAALKMRESLRAAEKQDWKAAAIRLAELPKSEKVPKEIAALLDVEESLEGTRYQLNRFDMEREGSEFWNDPAVDPADAHELAIAELVKRHRALASSGDYGKFRHLVFLRLLDTSMPAAAEKVDGERKQILDELRKKKKPRS